MMKTTANKITIARVLLVPIFMILAYNGQRIPALVVFVLACVSDFIDGYIARKYHQVSDFGKFMDPLADKMLTIAALCFLCDRGQIYGWVIAVILFREFAVSGLRLIAAENSCVIAAAKAGKIKTAVTMVCICMMLLASPAQELLNQLCSLLILVLTVYSGFTYFTANKDIFHE